MTTLGPAGPPGSARARVYEVIFEHDGGWPRAFDVSLIVAIVASVIAVMLESVTTLQPEHGSRLRTAEWIFTGLFTVEYLLRVWSARPARSYVLSFFGFVDLLAVIPTYLSLLVPGGQALAVVRIFRVVRVFRILKLTRYVGEESVLRDALRASRFKIAVFVVAVSTIVTVVGAVMYIVEGPSRGFTSIPLGVYWAIVTLTTVGYGDIAPTTPFGRGVAAFVMILGYAVIAVPTGIVTAELTMRRRDATGARACPTCAREDPVGEGAFCRWCGHRFRENPSPPSR